MWDCSNLFTLDSKTRSFNLVFKLTTLHRNYIKKERKRERKRPHNFINSDKDAQPYVGGLKYASNRVFDAHFNLRFSLSVRTQMKTIDSISAK